MNSSTLSCVSTGQVVNPPRTSTPVLQASSLFKGGHEIVIRHEGQDYRLRVTRQNKLILTK